MTAVLNDKFSLHLHSRPVRTEAYGTQDRTEILSLAAFDLAREEITSWPGYHQRPSCLSILRS
ncbi:hypothetical protein SAMN04488115_11960 [Bosea lathyri]|uniref:Uncharacterized protein n=1 Tax=Bosea lathyri TaxID=1036778 RepID=A0A1H6D960_9HYPH|nr:hypothetical protein SAMN04488115_11960 [Bosea lathyri]